MGRIHQHLYQMPNLYTSLDNELQSRKTIDLIINGWEITKDHLTGELFSESYYRCSQQLVVRADDRDFSKYTSKSPIALTELKQYTFGTGKGFKASELLDDAGIDLKTFDYPLTALNDGAVKIAMIDVPIAIYFIDGKGPYATHSKTLRALGQQ